MNIFHKFWALLPANLVHETKSKQLGTQQHVTFILLGAVLAQVTTKSAQNLKGKDPNG